MRWIDRDRPLGPTRVLCSLVLYKFSFFFISKYRKDEARYVQSQISSDKSKSVTTGQNDLWPDSSLPPLAYLPHKNSSVHNHLAFYYS